MNIIELLIRLSLAFVTLLALTRLMGRKEISQMTFFNFVSAISIGTIGASLAIDSALSVRNGMIAIIAWSALTVTLGFIDIKSKKARQTIEGQPIILIRNGRIMDEALRKTRLDLDELGALLRKKNVFSFSEVDYAIFETDGTLSVLQNQSKQSVTKADMHQPPNPNEMFSFPTAVIQDGKVVRKNLEKLNLDQRWLDQQLNVVGVNDVDGVFYAEVQKDGSLYIDQRNDQLH
ncbi:DUF421 domain-containing protein [Halobacillus litoralis]|uniref:DUF421 domain-containing protein n=1 Tax=Halobacillus litoralis TaxID=45668 RepID=A0A410M9N3_9BACI|nr:DUF421 domain-containing protein [Halobacillus litoralis]QAS51444.1 hypothetical protein HLI_04015 [Halobacillus litoralis]